MATENNKLCISLLKDDICINMYKTELQTFPQGWYAQLVV